MSDRKARLVRREAKRVLGDRTHSVVGEVRAATVELGTMFVTLKEDHEVLKKHHRITSDLVSLLHRGNGSIVGRLDVLEQREMLLRRSFWARVKCLFTGRAL